MILLLGVLALSWRLHNDPTTRPPVAQNPLTPGMGFVDDDSDSEADANILTPEADEEANLLPNGKASPFSYHRTSRPISWPNDPRTATPNKHDLSSIARLHAKKGITESEEIWEELEDSGDTPAVSFPFYRRRTSAQTTPYLKPSAISILNGTDAADDGESPTESTSFLRAGTGRSYRDKRRRRSMPGLETRRRSLDGQTQGAIGGWWKMRKWWYRSTGTERGKGNVEDLPNEDRNGA